MRVHVGIDGQVCKAWREEQVDGLADPNLQDDFDRDELVRLVELALWCARRRSAERPLMHQVMQRLHDLGVGGTSETVQHGIDLGNEYDGYDEYERDSSNIELRSMSSRDLDSETRRIFVLQYAR